MKKKLSDFEMGLIAEARTFCINTGAPITLTNIDRIYNLALNGSEIEKRNLCRELFEEEGDSFSAPGETLSPYLAERLKEIFIELTADGQ